MKINGKSWRTIWLENGGESIGVIDQTQLPHSLLTKSFKDYKEVACAISSMVVRGAPLIGVAGAYGLMLALKQDPTDLSLNTAFQELKATRPTAINLEWALNRIYQRVLHLTPSERALAAMQEATLIAEEDAQACESIGNHGLDLIYKLAHKKKKSSKGEVVNILTHCNAGWLATVDWGTALSPIYKAFHKGISIHVWVDETRPRNQGANLTAFELAGEGVPHTLVVDNAGGHLMQNGLVDAVFVGSDRVTRSGDAFNKVGTYLKALAAFDNSVPFYVATPFSTIDWNKYQRLSDIKIENRSDNEVTHVEGLIIGEQLNNQLGRVRIAPSKTKGFNPGFDITPSHLITSFITEDGIIKPSELNLESIHPQNY